MAGNPTRQRLQAEIAALIAEQQHWYTEFVLPSAAEAKLATPGGRRGGDVKVLPLELADQLDDRTPTGRFEKGRAHVEVLSARIASLRRQEAKLGRAASRPPADVIDREKQLRAIAWKILERAS